MAFKFSFSFFAAINNNSKTNSFNICLVFIVIFIPNILPGSSIKNVQEFQSEKSAAVVKKTGAKVENKPQLLI